MKLPWLVLIVAACGGSSGSTDIESTLTFADLTDVEISRLVSAASGSEGFQAQASVAQFEDDFDPDPCPLVALSGDTVTITGGCTTEDGMAIEGSATIENPLGWGDYEYDYGSDTIYQLNQLAFVQSGIRRSYDGTFVIGSNYTEMDMDITTDGFGAIVRSDVFLDCGRTSCSISGSGVELVGVGGATVSGTIVVGGSDATGSITMKGTDTVKVTIANNCVSWKLEGTDRAVNPCQR
jgi:hypothetical protein